jgi:hypothetical protein
MRPRIALLTLPIALSIGACSEGPLAPEGSKAESVNLQPRKGTGLQVDIVPDVTLPLGLGGSITIEEAVITNFAVLENVAGQIIGLEVTGNLTGTAVNAVGGLVGLDATPFTATASVTSSGPGQCDLVTIDLSNINVDALGLVTGTVPVNVTAKGSGAVGSLLCALGQALSAIGSAVGGASIEGLVNALNNQI